MSHRGPPFLNMPDVVVLKTLIEKIGDSYVEFKDGTRENVDAIIYATGDAILHNHC